MQNLSGWRILFPENNGDSEQSKVELVEDRSQDLRKRLLIFFSLTLLAKI